jgi:hypothetical protein
VDGRAKTKRGRRDDPAPNAAPPRRSKRLLDPGSLCPTFGPPSHPQVLRAREGTTGEIGLSTTSPIEVRSLSPTPADEALAEGGTLTRASSSSSSKPDFGPFIDLRAFDDADPRELAGEGWDSNADWGYGDPETCYSEVDGGNKTKQSRRKDSTSDIAPLRRSTRRRDHRALGSTHGSPSDPRNLGTREGAIGEGGQSTASPSSARSLLPTPADEVQADGGTRTRSSSPSSSRSDFGPFSALRSFDDADPLDLAGEGWDSDADWGFGGPEPCCSDVDGRDKNEKPRRQKDSAAAAAPILRSKRRRDPGALGSTLSGSPSDPQGVREGVIGVGRQSTVSPSDSRSLSPIPADGSLGGRKRPLPARDSFSKGGHQPVASSLHSGRSLPGKRGCRPRACRQEANEVGLLVARRPMKLGCYGGRWTPRCWTTRHSPATHRFR